MRRKEVQTERKHLTPGRVRVVSSAFVLFLVVTGTVVQASGGVTPRLSSVMQQTAEPVLCIVYFSDRGNVRKTFSPDQLVSPRALRRRAHVLPPDRLVGENDLPLEPGYVASVAERVQQLRHSLRWFNAVSAMATPAQIDSLSLLPFVREIDLVGRFRRQASAEPFVGALPSMPRGTASEGIDYGPSLNALAMLNVPAVHATGNSGQGILIGIFDNGFRLLSHTAFDSLRPRILATRDFVDHKVSVVPDDRDPSFGSHGIWTLSTIAGFKPGRIIGPAYGASFLLARTENDSSETPIEEDNWAAAIEWAESLGVQVTSTSLGFLTYDSPYTSWTWENMDGRTTLITRAAAQAVREGVVVVNSAGNNGPNSAHNTLNAPADADSVITAGAVNPSGARSAFSSVGPTTAIPPRIKPDVMAQGEEVRVASSVNDTAYGLQQGTSFSSPLIAGVAALILKARPAATPLEIATWLKATASNAGTPNNLIGWGIPDAAAAIAYPTMPPAPPVPSIILSSQPNPFASATTLTFRLPEPSRVVVTVFDILWRVIRELSPTGQTLLYGSVAWNGNNNDGRRVPTGVYFARLTATGASGSVRAEVQRILMVK